MPPKILVIYPQLTHPYRRTRVTMLRQAGWQVEVMAFRRNHPLKDAPSQDVTILGHIRQGVYLGRLPALLGAIPKVRAALRRSQLVYTFQVDMALLVFLAGLGLGKPLIYDIPYIRAAQTARSLKGRLLRAITRRLAAKSHLLIFTSPSYRHYFYDDEKLQTPWLALENKIETAHAAPFRNSQLAVKIDEERPLVIGEFSILREPWSLEFLECLNGLAKDKFEFALAGVVSPPVRHSFDRLLERHPNITYQGAYRRFDDVPALYQSADMILACTSPQIPFRWSMPVRYYDACLFRKPLIVRAGTAVADEVEKYDIGMVLHEDSPAAAAKEFSAVTRADWRRWRDNMAALPQHIYIHTDEVEQLGAALKDILNGQSKK